MLDTNDQKLRDIRRTHPASALEWHLPIPGLLALVRVVVTIS